MLKEKANKIKVFFLAYLPPTIWATLIYFLSAQEVLPGFTVSVYDFIFKKTAHMFVYAVLYILLFEAQRKISNKIINSKKYLIPIILSFAYALFDEIHQGTVPGRHPALRDTGYDMLGVSTVLLYQLKFI